MCNTVSALEWLQPLTDNHLTNSELCGTFSKTPAPHAHLPISDQILSLQGGYLFWKSPKRHHPAPKPA
jgi:hypothetical protein